MIATVLRRRYDTGYGLDAQDCGLFGYYGSFFLLLKVALGAKKKLLKYLLVPES